MDEKRGYVQMDVPMPQDMVAYLAALSARFNTCNTCDDQQRFFETRAGDARRVDGL